jgi:hypothetical protein
MHDQFVFAMRKTADYFRKRERGVERLNLFLEQKVISMHNYLFPSPKSPPIKDPGLSGPVASRGWFIFAFKSLFL